MASRFLFMMSIVSKNAFRCASLVCSSRRAPNSSCKARPCSMMGQAFSVQRSRCGGGRRGQPRGRGSPPAPDGLRSPRRGLLSVCAPPPRRWRSGSRGCWRGTSGCQKPSGADGASGTGACRGRHKPPEVFRPNSMPGVFMGRLLVIQNCIIQIWTI